MAGNANSGKRRVMIPTGKEAEEELRRIRRNERRQARRDRKAAEARGESVEDELDTPPPPSSPFSGELQSPEQTKLMFAEAFSELGGTAGLVAWGRRYPKEFYAIWARVCLPKDGEGGGSAPKSGLEGLLAQLDRRSGESVQ